MKESPITKVQSKEAITNDVPSNGVTTDKTRNQSTIPPFANIRSLFFNFQNLGLPYSEEDAIPRFIAGLNDYVKHRLPKERLEALRELYTQISSQWERFSTSILNRTLHQGSTIDEKEPIVRSMLDEVTRRIEEEVLAQTITPLQAQETAIVLRDKITQQAFAVVIDGKLQWLCSKTDVALIMAELRATLDMQPKQLARLAANLAPVASEKWNINSLSKMIIGSTTQGSLDAQSASQAVLPYLVK
jgi:hypothetical protein